MLTDACFKFALESLKKCMMMEPKTNVFFSPHLLYHNLLVIYFGTTNEIEESLRKILNIPDDISKAFLQQYYFICGYNQFCYIINGSDRPTDEPESYHYTCRIFSRIWTSECKRMYIETMNLFSSGHQLKEITFQLRPEHARNFFNNSIKSVTQGRIENLLGPESIHVKTEVVLFNAIYCKGQLSGSFDFDINNCQNKKNGRVRQMLKNENLNKDKSSSEKSLLEAYIMEVPCKEKDISTFFFFPSQTLESDKSNPTESDKIIKLIEQMTTEKGSEELRRLLDNGLSQKTNLVFPIFKLEQDLRMYDLLDSLGLSDIAPLGEVDLTEFTCLPMMLGDAVHRISINLTSSDITVAAANVFITENECQHERKDTDLDVLFPCVCLIYNRSRSNILFCGVLLGN
ncbi:PREDICTED: serpin B9-like [Wasmannia auropunctata]|uniref:serpin B9-like n=1 Tax=Wasmannia auropunctata TaxID=64793 RepID=UPI0005ED9FDC|nr:PREDICTED: serpin B9-like [Wasmannia auropunctata]